jgi:hypothetical protein
MFQVPVDVAILALAARLSYKLSRPSDAIVLTISDRPYGLFFEWCRILLRVYKNVHNGGDVLKRNRMLD